MNENETGQTDQEKGQEKGQPRLLGLAAPAGTGKSSLAHAILQVQPDARTYSLAWPLKQAAMTLYGLTREQVEDPGTKEKPVEGLDLTPRYILQKLGTEVCRQIKQDTLTWNLERRIAADRRQGFNSMAIIDDIRFDNEADFTVQASGMAVLLTRQGFTPPAASHATEQGIRIPKDPRYMTYEIRWCRDEKEYRQEAARFIQALRQAWQEAAGQK